MIAFTATSQNCKKIIGILGGMGPEATADLYMKIIRICQAKYGAKYDMDFPQIIINSIPIPDVIETSRIDDVLPFLVSGVELLENAGADFIIIACNTVQYFISKLRDCIKIPVISIPEEVSKILAKNNVKKAGILATDTTMKLRVYENDMEKFGIELVKPNPEYQNKITEIIMRILQGNKLEKDREILMGIVNDLSSQGCEAVIIGCTDLPLIINKDDYKVLLIDTTEVLADTSAKIAYGE